ncbi:tetratricopeptide repeat protein [Bacillus cereus group sp. MYBK228-1]|uniref:tetratricopeptide repeat protein n=1 Tax=unclassified Bacillus cereus group TaxID=2750818 RepID=UPI003F78BB6D
MEHIANQYNECIRLVQQGRIMQAKELILSLAALLPRNPRINWLLGLLEVYTGDPKKGITLWKVQSNVSSLQRQTIERVEAVLPIYEELYHLYNESVVLMKRKQYEEAKRLLGTVLGKREIYPLPAKVYYAYLLCLLAMGSIDLAKKELEQLPQYVKGEHSVLMLQKKYKLFEVADFEVQEKKSWLVHTIYASVLMLSLLSGGYFIHHMKESYQEEAVAKNLNEKRQNQQYKKVEQSLKEKNAALEKQIKENETQLSQETAILESSLMQNDSLKYKASWELYKDGRSLYKQGQYEKAITAFNNVRKLLSDSDIADDALYFTILSKIEVKDYKGIEKLYDEFLNNTSSNFKESDYIDAVLLSKARYFMDISKKDEAITILKKLDSEYGNKWTGQKAKKLLGTLLGERYE